MEVLIKWVARLNKLVFCRLICCTTIDHGRHNLWSTEALCWNSEIDTTLHKQSNITYAVAWSLEDDKLSLSVNHKLRNQN